MRKTIKCDQCDGQGTVLIDANGSIIDAPLFDCLLERVTCDDCDGSGVVEDESAEYKFNELDDDAKEHARDWYRELDSSDDYDCTIEDAVNMAGIMGIEIDYRYWTNSYGHNGKTPKIWWSGFSSQGDGASFEGSYSYKKGALKALMAEIGTESKGDKKLIQIARDLQHAQAAEFYQISTRITQSGHYYHANTMSFDHCRGAVGNGYDQNYYESDATQAIEEALRDFANWIYDQLENEYDFHNSDEYIDEAIEANEYDFDVEGNRA